MKMLWHSTIAPLHVTGAIGTACGISTDTRVCYTGLRHHPATCWDDVNCPECIAANAQNPPPVPIRSVCIAWPPGAMLVGGAK
jgi:hypothetical protein